MDEILKVKDVQEFLKVSRFTVYKLIRTGQIDAFYINSNTPIRKHPRIYLSALKKYLAQHKSSL